MQCPTCKIVNSDQARFCMGCGHLLTSGLVCGVCHTLLPSGARYCTYCGSFLAQPAATTPLSDLSLTPSTTRVTVSTPAAPGISTAQPAPSTESAPVIQPETRTGARQLPLPRPLQELLPSLQRYLPRHLYEPMERFPTEHNLIEARDHLAALLYTVKTYLPLPVVMSAQPAGEPAGGIHRGIFLFGDVSGFTPLSEQLKQLGQEGAEKITEIINNLFTELVQVLFAHGGTLLKFGGDALLGLFPAETDGEMAAGALRAAQAALAMQAVMKQDRFATIQVGDRVRALEIKCGISAGPYFAAHIGTKKSMAYVTTGHTVNGAEQAESHANPGDVIMTQAAYDLVKESVELGLVEKDSDESFHRLIHAPSAEGVRDRLSFEELPSGDLEEQMAYQVERLNRLTPYLNADLLDRIKANPGDTRIRPDHRPVTVLFANYKGISNLIEKMGKPNPELVTKRLNDYFVHMAKIVERYEGTLARMDQYVVGDRLVIFFGAPRAHEDDPVRAVQTALEMQREVREHFGALRTPVGVYRFEQRIGINTGYLFAGNAGAPDLRQEYTLMGDDINMAARLMSSAQWGEIYISDKTQERVSAFFKLSDRFELKVKGKEILIPTHTVLGRREELGPVRGLGGGESPLTGRDEVMATLQECGRSLLNKRGQIISIIGDSGLGKSRLKRELKSWLFNEQDADKVRWLDSQALSFSEQTSYWLAAQVLRGLLDLEPGASEDDVLYLLWKRGEELLGEEAINAIPFLAYLMGLELGEEWSATVEQHGPKARQKQAFWAAREFLIASARQSPTIIALDDLHWADEASLELTSDLLEVVNRAPIMFCLVSRARRDKGCWQLRDRAAGDFPHRFTEVFLKPLTRELSQQLLRELLPGAEFQSEIEQEILDKAAGNPFYLEEVVRSLMDSGAVVQDSSGRWRVLAEKLVQIAVPDTIQAAIIARIDRLTEGARQALQTAAVIGRQFQLDLLNDLGQAEGELDSLLDWLAQLERGGLVRSYDGSSDIYTFSDTLVQEVAYESLLVKSRHRFHYQIGEALENILADRLEQECELLAYHFFRSDDQERACKYLEMAAKKARDGYANATAIQHYVNLLEIKRNLGDQGGQADALYQMGVISYETGSYDQAKEWLEQAVLLRQALKDHANEGWAVMYMGMIDLKQANYDQATRHHEHARALAEGRQDKLQEGIHLTNLARVSLRMGAYERALEQFRKSLEMKEQMNDLEGQGFAHYYMGLVHLYQDHYEQAESSFQSALELWQQVERKERGISYCQHGLGRLALVRGQFAQAKEYFKRAYEISSKLVLKAEIIENLSFLGQAYLGLAELDAAAEVSHEAMALLTAQRDVEEVQQIYLNHYRVLFAANDPMMQDSLDQAYAIVMDQAGRIADEERRLSFLENVKANQEIKARVQ